MYRTVHIVVVEAISLQQPRSVDAVDHCPPPALLVDLSALQQLQVLLDESSVLHDARQRVAARLRSDLQELLRLPRAVAGRAAQRTQSLARLAEHETVALTLPAVQRSGERVGLVRAGGAGERASALAHLADHPTRACV